MNSEVIKFVAGAGKTTYSIDYLQKNANGLYLAFNNSVVDEITKKGFTSKTIDSFLQSYILPKFISLIPIIAKDPKIEYIDTGKLDKWNKGVGLININSKGDIFNKSKKTVFSILNNNEDIQESTAPNSKFIKQIFGKDKLCITDKIRSGLSDYLITNYQKEIINFIEGRFNYVIVDEAQDLNGTNEKFVKLLYNSKINIIILGDDKQNINNGGLWFESLTPTKKQELSYRCPEEICRWIREKLNININGNNNEGSVNIIDIQEAINYDNGKRVLLYYSRNGKDVKKVITEWKGLKRTIKNAKGSTINDDIVIVGKDLNDRALYTAMTRTTANVYSTINR